MYRNPNNKSKNEKLLKEKMIGAPFSDIQQEGSKTKLAEGQRNGIKK